MLQVKFIFLISGGHKYSNKSVLSYHYYDPPCIAGSDANFRTKMKDLKRLNVAGFLTELSMDDYPSLDLADQYM